METMRSLSEIPGVLIEQIVSYLTLTEKQAIQYSLLSKDFYTAVQNRRGALIFDASWNEKGSKEELSSLRSTLKRYHDENIKLESFTFKANTGCPSDMANECINLAMKLSPRNLDLALRTKSTNHGLGSVPKSVYGADSVEQLSLKQCVLEKGGPWPSLKKLSLEEFSMADIYYTVDRVFEEIVRSSPLLEILEISRSSMPTASTLDCFQNLKILSVSHVSNMGGRYLFDLKDGDKFPRLECLSIHQNQALSAIEMRSSRSLHTIELVNIHHLKMAHFRVPNVARFVYQNELGVVPQLTIMGQSTGWAADIKLECKKDIDSPWLSKLRDFLAELNGSEISITVSFRGKLSFNGNVGVIGKERRITLQHTFPVSAGSRALEIYQFLKLLEAHFPHL